MRDRPSQTAAVVAWMRATDQRRPPGERILDDPLAVRFLPPWLRAALALVDASGRPGLAVERWLGPGLTALVLARHRYIDDALTAALAEGPADQLVLLGAGYDSRPWRLREALGDAVVFEVDHPATARRKEAVASRLEPVDVRRVAVDFERESLEQRLLDSGFATGGRTLWVWEGVSMYLRRAAVRQTVSTLAALSGPGSTLALDLFEWTDHPSWTGTLLRASPTALHLIGEPITFGLHRDDAPSFLDSLGWRATDVASARELRSRYVVDGRRVYPCIYTVTATRD